MTPVCPKARGVGPRVWGSYMPSGRLPVSMLIHKLQGGHTREAESDARGHWHL